MKHSLNHHGSTIDEITADFCVPETVPEHERAERLRSHVVGALALKGIDKDVAAQAFDGWLTQLRGALRLFATPGQQPDYSRSYRAPQYRVDSRTGLVLAGRC